LADCPGVYFLKDQYLHKITHYAVPTPLCGNGVWWSAVWETKIDYADRRQTFHPEQLCIPARSVHLVALWVGGKVEADFEDNDHLYIDYNPLLEAVPWKPLGKPPRRVPAWMPASRPWKQRHR